VPRRREHRLADPPAADRGHAGGRTGLMRGRESCSVLAHDLSSDVCNTPAFSEQIMAGELYLEDLHVGRRFAAGPILVTAAEIKSFAAAFDPQPFHLDEAAAEATLFGGLAASGWHTAALTMRMLTAGGMPIATGVIGVGCEIEWPRPVRAGDELRVETEVLEIKPSRSKPNQAVVTMRSATINQNGDPVQILTAKLFAFARP
jgi:acyl dehydratase